MAARKKSKPKSADALPDRATAMRELTRREARAFTWMLVRLVCVAVLSTFVMRSPFAAIRPLIDGVGLVVVIFPLFTSLGRVFAWRIALGKAYVDARRFADADMVLRPLSGARAHLFDAGGEGRYHHAVALHALEQPEAATPLLQAVAQDGREPWRSQAARELAAPGTGTQKEGANSATV